MPAAGDRATREKKKVIACVNALIFDRTYISAVKIIALTQFIF